MSKNITITHHNAKGTGSALRLTAVPATEHVDGHLLVELAEQKTIADLPNGKWSTFDFQNPMAVCLGLSDISEIIQVFRGMQESIHDGKGLFHRTALGSQVIKFEHRIDPIPGYCLSVSERHANGTDRNGQILITSSEALTLDLAIEGVIPRLAFGE